MLPNTPFLLFLAFLSPLIYSCTAFLHPSHIAKTEFHPKYVAVLHEQTVADTASISATPSPLTKTPSRFPTPLHLATSSGHLKVRTPVLPTTGTIPSLSPTAKVITPASSLTNGWEIRSVSSMKETKDRLCDQPSDSFIQQWVQKAAELGVNYIAVETPYDSPSCADAVSYTRRWVQAIRSAGLKVWHRHMPLAFEGIYSTAKTPHVSTLPLITSYIHSHPDLFADGDIFTPIPEPQNGGIAGVTYCSQSICEFDTKEAFNAWLRDAMTQSQAAFSDIGLHNIKVGYYGFDGFVAWGDNNPDWNGILENSTISQMGNITIDHYPEAVGETMSQSLNELMSRYPGVKIVIGEWGTTTGGNVIQQIIDTMSAAMRPNVIGFNYWHMGMGGNESLINDDFSEKPQFATVKSFFTK